MPYIAKMIATRFIGTKLLDNYRESLKILQSQPNSNEIEEYHALLSVSKALSSWYSMAGIQAVRESLGGHGYSAHAGIGRLRNTQDLHTTWEGDNVILMQQTAKFVVKSVQKKMTGKEVNKSVQFLNPDFESVHQYRPRFTTIEELLNHDLLISLLEYKVNYLAGLSIEKLRENATSNFIESWNRTQVFYLQNLSKAFGELEMARAFWSYTPEATNPTTQVFKTCWFVFCLVSIHENMSLYLEQQCLAAPQVRLVENALNKLIDEVAAVSVRLFDVIGIKDFLHGSVLGREDGQVYAELIRRTEADPECYKKASWVDTLLRLRETGKVLRSNTR